jgi:hypothetical protein
LIPFSAPSSLALRLLLIAIVKGSCRHKLTNDKNFVEDY